MNIIKHPVSGVIPEEYTYSKQDGVYSIVLQLLHEFMTFCLPPIQDVAYTTSSKRSGTQYYLVSIHRCTVCVCIM